MAIVWIMECNRFHRVQPLASLSVKLLPSSDLSKTKLMLISCRHDIIWCNSIPLFMSHTNFIPDFFLIRRNTSFDLETHFLRLEKYL